jgi:hypothetical protein
VTYLLQGMRAFTMTGWNAHNIEAGFLAIGALGAITLTFAFRGLISRVR